MGVNVDMLLMERIKDLEQRVKVLEGHNHNALWPEAIRVAEEESDLVGVYGRYVDKTVASKILGVTRATVYAMLADGRIESAYEGKRVDVRSIARYITRKSRYSHAD